MNALDWLFFACMSLFALPSLLVFYQRVITPRGNDCNGNEVGALLPQPLPAPVVLAAADLPCDHQITHSDHKQAAYPQLEVAQQWGKGFADDTHDDPFIKQPILSALFFILRDPLVIFILGLVAGMSLISSALLGQLP